VIVRRDIERLRREVIRPRLDRELQAALCAQARREGLPLPVGGGTSFSGAETLFSISAGAGAIGPTASLLSLLSRECLLPVAPSYFSQAGRRFHVHAYGTISTTATVPTYQLQLMAGPTVANPLTGGLMLAQNATITPAASTTGNLEWWLDVVIAVRVPGTAGTLLAVGTLINDWVTAGTYVVTPFKNATPPTAVSISTTGGEAVPLYFDLAVIMGAATAGNTATCADYQFLSLN
jgi:hypothetical protein